MFKFLLFFFLISYLLYRVFMFLFKYMIIKKIKSKFNQFDADSRDSVNIGHKTTLKKTQKDISKDSGEFVDFEELD